MSNPGRAFFREDVLCPYHPRRGECHPAIADCVGPPPLPLTPLDRFPVYADGVRMGVLVFDPGALGGVLSVWAAYFFRVNPPTCVSPLGRFSSEALRFWGRTALILFRVRS